MAQKQSILHLIGTRINRLTILEDLGNKYKQRKVLVKCDCGKIKSVILFKLISQSTKSCGCWNRDKMIKHGIEKHPLYKVWKQMIGRCYNTSFISYPNYGGNGVKVCDEWRNDIMSFYNWAVNNGWEKGLELDKDKLSPNRQGFLYCPEYCCFLTRKENTHYRKTSRVISYNGLTMCMAEWVEKYNLNYGTFKGRLNRGWSMDEIINTPVLQIHKKLAS